MKNEKNIINCSSSYINFDKKTAKETSFMLMKESPNQEIRYYIIFSLKNWRWQNFFKRSKSAI